MMHTAFSLNSAMFTIDLDDGPADREMLLDWRPDDRLGVLVTAPLGGLGASMLMQLATTAYFDARPSRREAPHYAEIYVFHFGGRYGDFTSLDVLPRREVFLDADRHALIEAINDRAITHLAIPASAVGPLDLPWSEAEAARDRIRHCYVYDAHGRTDDADILISSADPVTQEDIELTLDPERLLEDICGYIDHMTGATRVFSEKLAERLRSRLHEVSKEDRARVRKSREAVSVAGVTLETYRKVSINDALGMVSAYPAARG